MKEYPFLCDEGWGSKEFPNELRDLYHSYVPSISKDFMAVSPELSAFCLSLCRHLEPRSILDLGSGYSSAVFRYYARTAQPTPTVVSVDDSPGWLERTSEFLRTHDLPFDNLVEWESFQRMEHGRFDMVFYDLGHVRGLRTTAFEKVIDFVGPGGVLILDDMNFIGYKRHVKRMLKKSRLRAYSAEHFTRDSFGRYAYLMTNDRLSSDPHGPEE